MRNFLDYHKSIADEFAAIQDRVRYFIGNRHWGEDGRYKEVILMNFLKKILPSHVSVGTGFVKNGQDELTSQIDIIIYNNQYPKFFSEGDFVILVPQSVIGIIEVKSKAQASNLNGENGAVRKAERNGKIIGNKKIFNGIFAYRNDIKFNKDFKSLNVAKELENSEGYLNHLALGDKNFIRYWDDQRKYSAYRLIDKTYINEDKAGYAYGYFISNLLEVVHSRFSQVELDEHYFDFLYPIEGTKEGLKIEGGDIFNGIDN